MAFPTGWEETAIVTIERFNATTPVKFHAHTITESVDLSEPDYPGEGIPNVAGGRIWKQSPQEDGEITLELYPTQLAEDTDTTPDTHGGLFQFFPTNQTIDTTTPAQPMTTATSYTAGVDCVRDRFCVAILWTNDTTSGERDATSTTAASTDSLRFAAISCRMTSHKSSFTDGILKTTVTFKFPAMNQDGSTTMFKWESGSQTALVALFTAGGYNDEDSWT